MAGIFNYLLSFFVTKEEAAPVAGLTAKDRNVLTKSWGKVMEQPTQNGIKFFMRLFEIQPKHQIPFPFRDIATKDLPTDRKFKAHVNAVMYSISSVISNLNDEEILTAILQKIGTSHVTRSVDRQALKDVKQALMDTFKFMEKSELDVWSKLLDVLVDVVASAIEEEKNNKQQTCAL